MVTPINQSSKLTLLQLINAATAEIGLPQYTNIVGNVDTQAMQLLALAKREGKEFYQMGIRNDGWEELRAEYVFNLLPSYTATGNVAASNVQITNVSASFYQNINSALLPVVSGSNIDTETFVTGYSQSLSTVQLSKPALSTAVTGGTYTFSTERYPMPSDFAYFMTTTAWDRSYRWQLLGPLSAQEWQVLKSGISPTGPRRRYRVMNNYIYFDPIPQSLENIAFEYYSNGWAQSSAGVSQSTWQADTDYYALDDDCFIQGLKWRVLAAKKMDYGQEKESYDMTCQRVAARNGGNRDLPINARNQGIRLLNNSNVPDTGYGA